MFFVPCLLVVTAIGFGVRQVGLCAMKGKYSTVENDALDSFQLHLKSEVKQRETHKVAVVQRCQVHVCAAPTTLPP